MTGLDGWQAGHEIGCPECMFIESNAYGEPVCILASEFFLSGETMSASCCPEPIGVAA